MEVTEAMLLAAMRQAVIEKVFPKFVSSEETYLHNWAVMKRILEQAVKDK